MSNANLSTLVARLKECPARDTSLAPKHLLEGWNELRMEEVPPDEKPSLTVMAVLLLGDVRFKPLLTDSEHEQLLHLVDLAIDRYEQRTQPTNKLGKLLAGILRKS